MKTNFRILFIIILLYSCQNKDSEGHIEDNIEIYPVESSQIDKRMLEKWLSFNRESDSIITAGQLIIEQKRDEVESHPPDEREYMSMRIMETQKHLDNFKNKVKFIRSFARHIKNWDPSLKQKHDSLKLDYMQGKLKLENALSEFTQ
jgi:hypothetical protein